MQKLFSFLMMPVLLLGAGCVPKSQTVPVQPVPQVKQAFGASVMIAVGNTVVFEDGLHVMLETISDSRCPPDAVCIWQGELSPVLQLSGGSLKEKTELIFGTAPVWDKAIGEYLLTLMSATESSIELMVRKGPR